MVILGLCYPNKLATMLSWKPLMFLGESSYALYLFHFAYNDLARSHGVPETIPGLAWRMLIVVPVSGLLYVLIERPGRRWILQRFAMRK